MKTQRILISGVGIAGPALAYWLNKYGFEITLVEQAPTFRDGGYIIDFWGVGYDLAEKMNLLSDLRKKAYDAKQIRFVDKNELTVGGFSFEAIRSQMKNRMFSICRGDLARVIFESVQDSCETIFGDSIVSVTEKKDAVVVSFNSRTTREFDLVIGADGLHSAVRKIVFGSDSVNEVSLGYYVAAFSLDGYRPRNEDDYVAYCLPGKQMARFALRDDRTVFYLIFSCDHDIHLNHLKVEDKIAIVRHYFEDIGWESDSILEQIHLAEDIYIDKVSQIRMKRWTKGRVALLGDAAYCPSLLSGQGSAFAMLGAYVLAGELFACNGNYQQAFANYEALLMPFMFKKQLSAEKFGSWFAPKTKFGLCLRNELSKLLDIPVFGKLFFNSSLGDNVHLTDYQSEAK